MTTHINKIRKKAKPFYAIDYAFDVLYIYTWRIIDNLHVNVHVKNIQDP